MSAGVLATALVVLGAGGPMRADVDGVLAGGVGALASFGGAAQLTIGRGAWATSSADGWLSGGVLAGYQREDFAGIAWQFPGTRLSGATHRVEALLLVGHDLRFTAARRLLLSVQLFAGWAHVFVRGTLSNPEVGVAGAHAADAGVVCSGVQLRLGLRLTERVSFVAGGLVPFPDATAVMPWVLVTMGASVRL